MKTNEITNTEDTIDSRDVIARIEELRSDLDSLNDDIADAEGADATEAAQEVLKEWEEEYVEELRALEALASEAEGYAADWSYGETLIRDSYFKEYAQDLADDIGAVDRDAKWPNTCIDWDQAARELLQDYTSVDFDGVTYWVR
jgi:hypothetical protein